VLPLDNEISNNWLVLRQDYDNLIAEKLAEEERELNIDGD